jgi:hypothetical protein
MTREVEPVVAEALAVVEAEEVDMTIVDMEEDEIAVECIFGIQRSVTRSQSCRRSTLDLLG